MFPRGLSTPCLLSAQGIGSRGPEASSGTSLGLCFLICRVESCQVASGVRGDRVEQGVQTLKCGYLPTR